jgi:opacity protein-like surface antigen
MRAFRAVLAAAALLAGAGTVVPAFAQYYPGVAPGYWYGPGVGLYYGAPYTWGPPGYYGQGYYGPGYGYGYGYAVPGYTYGAPPPMVYIERNQPVTPAQPPAPVAPAAPSGAAPGNDWWYLCASPRGAYPYVRECPGGWERVPAVPPGQVR